MTILLFLLVFLLAILFLWQQAKQKTIDRELRYIRERLAQAFYTRENAYILVPSENLQTKELAAEINRLLDTFYARKTEYELSRQTMVQMMTNISHDLRTPLTVLKGYSELLGREVGQAAGKENVQDMAAKIDEKANTLIGTIDAYFTMSKITSGDMKIDLQRTNVSQICHEVILDYYDILEEKEYDVEIEIGSSPEYAYVDVDAFKRILKNLLDNAILHGGDGKYLSLRLKRMSGEINIEVEDHGQGILEKDQEQIFCRTYTTAHKGSGSGLGLTIAKNLALQMDADIRVMSEPGKKTVFTLVLKR
ncbi:MAG: HAMP domain-containing histidine kinase [Blautia sp.]|nr:HAMP domain-containing histidine kinase [Lachnoclostridium sp.]MCM1210376.1 HAMP domain-containing histidine kinase [Blautia sp.]